jgi:hypothetical protein
LLVKRESRIIDIATRQEMTEEKIVGDYKDQEGFLRPTKILVNRDGTKLLELEITEIKILEKLDASFFERP